MLRLHPFLKRDLFRIFYLTARMFGLTFLMANNRKIGVGAAKVGVANASSPSPPPAAVGIAQRDLISGKALIDHSNEEEKHFAMLKEAWEKPFNQ